MAIGEERSQPPRTVMILRRSLPSPPAWMRSAACQDKPGLPWTSERKETTREQRAAMRDTCHTCPVVDDCYAFASNPRTRATVGFWAARPARPTPRLTHRPTRYLPHEPAPTAAAPGAEILALHPREPLPAPSPAPVPDPVLVGEAPPVLLDLADAIHEALAEYEHAVLTWHLPGVGGQGRHPRDAMYAAFEALYRYARTLAADNSTLRHAAASQTGGVRDAGATAVAR